MYCMLWTPSSMLCYEGFTWRPGPKSALWRFQRRMCFTCLKQTWKKELLQQRTMTCPATAAARPCLSTSGEDAEFIYVRRISRIFCSAHLVLLSHRLPIVPKAFFRLRCGDEADYNAYNNYRELEVRVTPGEIGKLVPDMGKCLLRSVTFEYGRQG